MKSNPSQGIWHSYVLLATTRAGSSHLWGSAAVLFMCRHNQVHTPPSAILTLTGKKKEAWKAVCAKQTNKARIRSQQQRCSGTWKNCSILNSRAIQEVRGHSKLDHLGQINNCKHGFQSSRHEIKAGKTLHLFVSQSLVHCASQGKQVFTHSWEAKDKADNPCQILRLHKSLTDDG